MAEKFVEYYNYRNCTFIITRDKLWYHARCAEICTHDEDLEQLKKSKIPQCYHMSREIKI